MQDDRIVAFSSLPVAPMGKAESFRTNRSIGCLVTGVLILIWAVGLQDAILGGLNPGYVHHRFDKPYPTRAVAVTCGIISIELALLYAILRPFRFSRPRVLVGLAFFGILWLTDLFLASGWTDQAGYCYSNGFVLRTPLGFLVFTAVADLAFLRNRGHG